MPCAKRLLRNTSAWLICWLLLANTIAADTNYPQMRSADAVERWYASAQVEAGEGVFRENCIECHGERAGGTVQDWRKPNEDGRFPPPPLDGTAHAWHHPKQILFDTITGGGAALGGWMPAFKLSKEQILAVIAYIQDLWSDSVYKDWKDLDGSSSMNVEEFFNK